VVYDPPATLCLRDRESAFAISFLAKGKRRLQQSCAFSMSAAHKSLILLEPVTSSQRGAKRRGNRRCLELKTRLQKRNSRRRAKAQMCHASSSGGGFMASHVRVFAYSTLAMTGRQRQKLRQTRGAMLLRPTLSCGEFYCSAVSPARTPASPLIGRSKQDIAAVIERAIVH
jgi:hypothetical protein